MLNFDTTRLPTGAIGWTALFAAVEAAAPEDENQWLEFKAGIDPGTPDGAAALAKAIVAFANRRVDIAQKWLGGHALVLVGIEPGNVVGASVYDPAVIHDRVQRLLAAPAPAWDCEYRDYHGKPLLVITVDPPQQGDPIHCIGRSSGPVEDGHIYVRRPGKSDRAKSDDIRALSTRMSSLTRGLDIEVGALVEGGQRRCTWSPSWLDSWELAERKRLIGPLDEFLEPPPPEQPLNPYAVSLRDVLRTQQRLADIGSTAFNALTETEPEERTPEEFRDQVDRYLAACREALEVAPALAAARALNPVTWFVNNLSAHNLEGVEVKVHVEGEVEAFESTDDFRLSDLKPSAPRPWGPRRISKFLNQEVLMRSASAYNPGPPSLHFTPKPIIENGGSVHITFPEVHLRPRATGEVLDDENVLVVSPTCPGPIRCTWTATATNLSGVAEGEFTLPVEGSPIDIGGLLQHRVNQRGRTMRPGQTGDGWQPSVG